MQGGPFDDEFDRFYAESLSGGVKVHDPNSEAAAKAGTPSELLDAALLLETIPDAGEDFGADRRPSKTSEASYAKGMNASVGDRRWSNASSAVSSRSRSSSSGSSHRGLSIPERVAVTREGLVEQIIEKWRMTAEEHLGHGGRIIITDDENNSRFHDMMSSSSSSSGSRPRAHTFSGRPTARSPTRPTGISSNSDDPLVDSFDATLDEPDAPRHRAYSANSAAAVAANSMLGEHSGSRRNSQIFHFSVDRRPSVAGRLLSFFGARPEPRRCEIAIRQLTPLEASNVPSSGEMKNMELLLVGQEAVGKKEIVRSLLTAATVPPHENERNRLPSIDSEISWDEQTCIVARCYLEVDQEVINFTARCATTEDETERCLMQCLPDFVLAIYSVAEYSSVGTARSLLSYAAQRTPKRVALCMVANKADLSGLASGGLSSSAAGSPMRRELSGGSVSRSTGRAAAKSVGASWIETSAVISLNIRTLLAALLQHWVHNNVCTIAEEPNSRRSSVNHSRSGSFKQSSSNKPSRSNSLLVRQDDLNNPVTMLSRAKSERSPRSRSPSDKKLNRPPSSNALISACHPILTALCISKPAGAVDDRNSNSNDSGVHDSPGTAARLRQSDPNESAL